MRGCRAAFQPLTLWVQIPPPPPADWDLSRRSPARIPPNIKRADNTCLTGGTWPATK